MDRIDPLIHQPTRLRIMSVLAGLGENSDADFPRLKKILNLSDGNLGIHLQKLEEAGYIRMEKEFVGKKPRTGVVLTEKGSQAFRDYVSYLESLLKNAD